MGNAGIKLKIANTMFTKKKLIKKLFELTPFDNWDSICSEVLGRVINQLLIRAKVIFTKGPANATTNSSEGFSGSLSNRANPPIGKRVMSMVLILYFFAINACPNSCKITVVKMHKINNTDHKICVAF